jgi:hypothetical protein
VSSLVLPELPPSAGGRCDPALEERLRRGRAAQLAGRSANASLRGSKHFYNPDIGEKLVQFWNLNEIGTNYPPHLYDPTAFDEFDYYNKLAELQNDPAQLAAFRKRRKPDSPPAPDRPLSPASPSPVPPPPPRASAAPAPAATTTSSAAAASSKRSKWDQSAAQGLAEASRAPRAAPAPQDTSSRYREFIERQKQRSDESRTKN